MSTLAAIRAGIKAPAARLVFARTSLVHNVAKTATVKAAENVKPKHTLEVCSPAFLFI